MCPGVIYPNFSLLNYKLKSLTMKTIRLLFLICLLGCFSMSISYAQGIKYCITQPFIGEDGQPLDYFIPCTGEYVNGYLNKCMFWNGKDKSQLMIDGEVVCEETGNVYTVHEVVNQTWHVIKVEPANVTIPFTMTFHLDGKLVFLIHANYHATVNANGELVVEFENRVVECK